MHRELQTQLNSNINSVFESSMRMIESIGDIGRHVAQVNVESLYHNMNIIQKYFITYRSVLETRTMYTSISAPGNKRVFLCFLSQHDLPDTDQLTWL